MKVGQSLRQVFPKAVFVAAESIGREQGNVFQIYGGRRVFIGQKNTESRLLERGRGRENQLIFCPFAALYLYRILYQDLTLVPGGRVAKGYGNAAGGRFS